jgi:hypothetical protein
MKQLTLDQVEILLLIVTEHNRTSCDDFNLSNAYKHYEDGTSRCTRCVLIYAKQTGFTPEVELTINARGI